MKPLLLLDIDGVLCPYDSAWPNELERIPGHRYAFYNPRHSIYLKELAGIYDLAWASMWMNDANVVLAPLYDLEPLPFVNFTARFSYDKFKTAQTFKLDAVQRFVEDRPMVWVDDDFYKDAFRWARERNETIPSHLIHTDPTIGLDHEMIQELREWPKKSTS